MHRTDMDGMSRRDFLRASGVTGAGALLAGANTVSFAQVAQAATRQPLPVGSGILVIVTLYGGNDGLNTVVPYADPLYQQLRPALAYSESELLPIGEGLGLNGGLSALTPLWQAGRMAIVRGVGYPSMNRSHFTSMDIWQSASPEEPSTSGWIGRWLEAFAPTSMSALSIGGTMPPMLVGTRLAGSALPLAGLTLPSGDLRRTIRMLGREAPGYPPLRAAAAGAIGDLYDNAGATRAALDTPVPGAPPAGSSSLAQQLDVVARLVHASAPTRVYSVSLGGFDTHADERGTQRALLAQLGDALAGFMAQVDATAHRDHVTVLVYSEFGRRVPANLSQGTDHGSSGPAFVLGNRVRGGLFGAQPSLSRLYRDDLEVTTDFRDIYATLLEQVLAADADAVLPGWGGRLPLFAGA